VLVTARLPATSGTLRIGETELGEMVGLGAVTTVWARSWTATNAVRIKGILFINVIFSERLPAGFRPSHNKTNSIARGYAMGDPTRFYVKPRALRKIDIRVAVSRENRPELAHIAVLHGALREKSWRRKCALLALFLTHAECVLR
jgi:hypothetical protein